MIYGHDCPHLEGQPRKTKADYLLGCFPRFYGTQKLDDAEKFQPPYLIAINALNLHLH